MLRVDFEQVEALAQDIGRTATQLNDLVSHLTSAFNANNSYWEGNAQREFEEAFRAWNDAWRQMHQSLDEMQSLIRQWTAKARELDSSVRRR